MAVDYTTDITRPVEAASEIVDIRIQPPGRNNPDPHIFVTVARLDPNDIPIGERTFVVGSQAEKDEGIADFSFAQYLVLDPSIVGLAARLEQALMDAGKLPPGVVS